MSIKPIVNNPGAKFNRSLSITSFKVESQILVTNEIAPPVGGELCANELCVKCEDGEKLQYQTPNVGASGEYLTSNGDGTIEFTELPPVDLSELEGKTQNINATAGTTDIDGIVNTDNFSFKAVDGSVINLRPNDVGQPAYVLKTDGVGGTYFGPDTFNPAGVEYSGTGVSANNKVCVFNSNDGLTARESSNITDTPLGCQFNGTSINNINNVQCNSVTKLGAGDLEIKSNVDCQANQIKNIVDGTLPTDVVSKGYVDNIVGNESGRIDTLEDKTQNITADIAQTTINGVQITSGLILNVINSGSGTSVPNKNYVDAANNVQNTTISDISDRIVGVSRTLLPDTTTVSDSYSTITSTQETKLDSDGLVVLSNADVPKFRTTATSNQSLQQLDMGFNKIITLGPPTIGTDAANKNYVDSQVGVESGRIDTLETKTQYTTADNLGNYAVNSTDNVIINSTVFTDIQSDTLVRSVIGGNFKVAHNATQSNHINDNVVLEGTTILQLESPNIDVIGPINMNSNRILNVGAAVAPSDAMNQSSVEAITDTLDNRLIAVEDRTVCLSVTGGGPNAELLIDCESKVTIDTEHFVVSDPNGGGTNPKFEVNDPSGPVLNTTTISNQLMKINADLGTNPASDGIHMQIGDADKLVVLDNIIGMSNIDSTNNDVAVQYSNKIGSSQKELLTSTLSEYSNATVKLTASSVDLNGPITCNNNNISNVLDPVLTQDVATKAYVDANAGSSTGGFVLENSNNNTGTISSGFATPTVYYPFVAPQSGNLQGVSVVFANSNTCSFKIALYNGDIFGSSFKLTESGILPFGGFIGRSKLQFPGSGPTVIAGNAYTLGISASNNTSQFEYNSTTLNKNYFCRHENANYTATTFPATLSAVPSQFNRRILSTFY